MQINRVISPEYFVGVMQQSRLSSILVRFLKLMVSIIKVKYMPTTNKIKLEKDYYSTNKKWWEKMVKEECGFTKPWLDLDINVLKKVANGKIKNPSEPIRDIYPLTLLSNINRKNILCLASGGGQQSAIFGVLGGNVTVIDISEEQLKGDKKAAEHYGYKVKTIQGDISSLSMLKSNLFDIVYQAVSMGYIPDVKKVYSEVFRVLKKGGVYRADAHNPISWAIDENSWDGKGYRISDLYSLKAKKRSKTENVFEFRHYLSEVFNGLIDCGFIIERVEELPSGHWQENSKPGSWGHSLLYSAGYFAILARKK